VAEVNFSWKEWLPWRRWRIGLTVEAADEVPDELPPRVAVLVGSLEKPKWLAFDCPCREGHRIMVNLDAHNRPYWRATGKERLSLWPSIDAWRGKKRCHYVVKDGKIFWT
jgi:Family of unknown function (DUF6527)